MTIADLRHADAPDTGATVPTLADYLPKVIAAAGPGTYQLGIDTELQPQPGADLRRTSHRSSLKHASSTRPPRVPPAAVLEAIASGFTAYIDDHAEGVGAFLAKRKPSFQGR